MGPPVVCVLADWHWGLVMLVLGDWRGLVVVVRCWVVRVLRACSARGS
jgi:hypothetical protein